MTIAINKRHHFDGDNEAKKRGQKNTSFLPLAGSFAAFGFIARHIVFGSYQ